MNIKEKQEKRSTIMIVDDTPRVRQALAYLLNKENYETLIANNGSQGLNMALEYLPDLILLDVMMPEMDGFTLCRKLKENETTKNIPVIFLTAKTSSSDIIKGFEVGAVDYVKKPYNTTELLARAKTHLELKKIRDREKELKKQVEECLNKIEMLSELIPVCIDCKKEKTEVPCIKKIEKYIEKYGKEDFKENTCPECKGK